MHGLGNDYVYVNCLDADCSGLAFINDGSMSASEVDKRLSEIAVAVSDRHFGIGADGMILIMPSATEDFRMRMFNADGSEGRMCGNGVRCIGKFVYDNGLTDREKITLETLSGVKYLTLHPGDDGLVESVTVDMGEPEFIPELIPVKADRNIDIPFIARGEELKVTAVSMGNPHGVVFVDDLSAVDVHGLGRELEKDPAWPDRANIEFAQVVSGSEIVMRVWERGSGETMACGTGACATAVAAALTGRASRRSTVKLLGGDLLIEWTDDNRVMMTGPATTVFSGEYPLK